MKIVESIFCLIIIACITPTNSSILSKEQINALSLARPYVQDDNTHHVLNDKHHNYIKERRLETTTLETQDTEPVEDRKLSINLTDDSVDLEQNNRELIESVTNNPNQMAMSDNILAISLGPQNSIERNLEISVDGDQAPNHEQRGLFMGIGNKDDMINFQREIMGLR